MKIRSVLTALALTAAAAGSTLLGVTPAHAAGVVCQDTIEVAESAWDVNTGCAMQDGDRVEISASGSIWAGVWFTGNNGPQGWSNIANDSKFPMRTARAYSLLAKVNGYYRYVGVGTNFTYTGSGSTLFLRINDDSPGNGNGAFVVDVKVIR